MTRLARQTVLALITGLILGFNLGLLMRQLIGVGTPRFSTALSHIFATIAMKAAFTTGC